MAIKTITNTYYKYGDKQLSWYSRYTYETEEKCVEEANKHMIDQVLAGYKPDKDIIIVKTTYTKKYDENGLIFENTSTERIDLVNLPEDFDWVQEMENRINSIQQLETYDITNLLNQISTLCATDYITNEDMKYLVGIVDDKKHIRQIYEGDFTEGSTVRVNIDGSVITRKVRWDAYAKDLYVVKDNKKYFYCEFWQK